MMSANFQKSIKLRFKLSHTQLLYHQILNNI